MSSNSSHPPSIARQILAAAVIFGLTFGAAALGAWASASAASFYAELSRPAWAPPAWLFGPVWSALYLLMAIAAWLVWRAGGWSRARGALALYGAQLAVNALWSWLFFAWREGAWALADIALLLGLLLATIVRFSRHHRLAALLLLPYLAWAGFAAALCFAVWQMNPDAL